MESKKGKDFYIKRQRQLGIDTSNSVLIENNGVAQKWVAIPFWSDIVFNENRIASLMEAVAALTLTLGVNGPLPLYC